MQGRKPTPASLIDPAASKRSKEEVKKREEVEASLKTKATLKCPQHLSKQAKVEWRRIMRLYKGMDADILTDLDMQPLTMYCEAIAIYKKAQETWVKYQAVVSSKKEAQQILNACFNQMEKQTKITSKLAEQLCLTPVGRARMGIYSAKNNNEPSILEKLFDT